MLVRLVLACHQIKRTTCPWAGWVLTCPTVGRWTARGHAGADVPDRGPVACLPGVPQDQAHHLPVAMPVLTCPTVGRWPACLACHQIGHQIKRTTCPWA